SAARIASAQGSDERRPRGPHRAHHPLRQADERGRARPHLPLYAPQGCGDADPGRPRRPRAQGPARQTPSRPQIHAGEIRLSRWPRRSGRSAHAGGATARSFDRSAPDEAAATPERGKSACVRARRHPRDVRGDWPPPRRARPRHGTGSGRAMDRVRRGEHPSRSRRVALDRPRHPPAGPAAPVRRALLHHGCERDRAPHRRRDRSRRRTGGTRVDAACGRQSARHAGGDRRDAGRARLAHRRRLRPRAARSALQHAARPVPTGDVVMWPGLHLSLTYRAMNPYFPVMMPRPDPKLLVSFSLRLCIFAAAMSVALYWVVRTTPYEYYLPLAWSALLFVLALHFGVWL